MKKFASKGIVACVGTLAIVIFALAGCGSPYAEGGDAATTDVVAQTAVASTQDPSLYEVGRYMTSDATGPVGPAVAAHEAESGKVSISITIDTTGANGTIMRTENPVTLDEGATAYDAVVQVMGADAVNAQDSQYGKNFTAIGGVAQGEHGSGSGWMYDINGTLESVSSDQYMLTDGDALVWFYVTGDV